MSSSIQEFAECLFGGLGTACSIEDDNAIRFGHVWQRPDDASLVVVRRLPIRHDVDRLAIAPASLVQRAPMELLGRDVVVDDHQQVMVAIRARAATSARTEQDYLAWIEVLDDRLQQVSRDFARSHAAIIARQAIVRDCGDNAAAPWRGCRWTTWSTSGVCRRITIRERLLRLDACDLD
jgi:hypothetical protein